MNFNIFYGGYCYQNEANFSSLAKQCEVSYEEDTKVVKEMNEVDAFVSQEMRNPQMDLNVPNCKCTRK